MKTNISALSIILLCVLALACSKNEPNYQTQEPSNLSLDKDYPVSIPNRTENRLPFEKLHIPLDDDMFTGDYLVKQITPGIFGYDTFDPDGGGVVLTLFCEVMESGASEELAASSSMQRAFVAEYLAELGYDNRSTYIIEFFSEKVYFPYEQYTGLGCGGESITLGFPLSAPGVFDTANDSIFSLRFLDDVNNSCSGQQLDVELLFTKL